MPMRKNLLLSDSVIDYYASWHGNAAENRLISLAVDPVNFIFVKNYKLQISKKYYNQKVKIFKRIRIIF